MVAVAQVVQACSGPVAPATMAAVIATESGGDPWAIYVNGMGPRGSMRFPNKEAAVNAAVHYIRLGYKVDMGLAQVDSENLAAYGLSVSKVFNPCTNVRTGAAILTAAYRQALAAGYAPGAEALTHGFEAYNSGATTGDFGYAKTVWRHAGVKAALGFSQSARWPWGSGGEGLASAGIAVQSWATGSGIRAAEVVAGGKTCSAASAGFRGAQDGAIECWVLGQ